jgi:hypothetical protein
MSLTRIKTDQITDGEIKSADLDTNIAITLASGTANGVAYLNGSKVLTSGTALTFDGSTLNVNVSASNPTLNINRTDAATPGIFSIENGNSAIFIKSSTTKPLAFYLNNIEEMRLTSTGLGIGTSSPDVYGRFYTRSVGITSAGSTVLQIRGTSYGAIDIGDATRNFSITSNSTITQIATVTNTPISFITNSTERMRIDSDGRVGIGTTNLVRKFRAVDAADASADFRTTDSTDKSFEIDVIAAASQVTIGTGTNHPLVFKTNDIEKMRINAAGKVSIGTTRETEQLNLPYASYLGWGYSSSNSQITHKIGKPDDGPGPLDFYISYSSGSTLEGFSFTSNNFGRLITVLNGGNVGIGTASPGNRLSVVSASAGDAVTFSNAGASNKIGYLYTDSQYVGLMTIGGAGNNQGILFDLNNNRTSIQRIGGTTATFDSAGNVGIGTSSPNSRFDVRYDNTVAYDSTADDAQRTNTATINICNDNGTTGTFAQLVFDTAGSNQAIARIVAVRTGPSTNDLAFVTEGSNVKREVMRITSAGNVGIGVTPDAWYSTWRAIQGPTDKAFAIAGNNGMYSVDNAILDASATWRYARSSTASYYQQVNGLHAFYTAPSGTAGDAISFTQIMMLKANGNVGIGTSAPSTLLHLSSFSPRITLTDTDTGADHRINADSSVGNLAFDVDVNSETASPVLVVNIKGSERFRITSAGNVGIGTSSPASLLDVAGKGFFRGSGSFEALELITSDANRVYITGNSSINGDMWRFGTSVSNQTVYIDALRSSGEIAFRTGGANQRMTIDSSGNVGIGTSSPVTKLDVDGQITSRGSIGAFIAESRDGNGAAWALYNPTGDDVRIFGNSADRLIIDNSGNVGIGTTDTTNAKLTIDSGTNNAALFLNSTDGDVNLSMADNTGHVRLLQAGGALAFRIGGAANTFGTGDDEKMRITSGGRVGIGTSSPIQPLSVVGHISINMPSNSWNSVGLMADTSGNAGILYSHGSFRTSWICNGYRNSSTQWTSLGINGNSGAAMIEQDPTGDIIFRTDANKATGSSTTVTERARIDSSGNLLVGRTNTSGADNVAGFYLNSTGQLVSQTNANSCLFLNRFTSNGAIATFRRQGTDVGSISVTTTATAYNTSSDYRLKEDAKPLLNPIDRLMGLKPINFAWKVDGSRTDGFLAHEAQAVVPEAVTGIKDAVDANGDPEYQGIDQSKLVPLLTAALQELSAKVDALQSELNTLKGN